MDYNDLVLIEVGRGVAKGKRSFGTGEKAARKALAAVTRHPVSAALVFASVQYDLEEMLSGIQSVVGEVALFGASTAGEICDDLHDKSIVVAALASPHLSVRIGLGQKVSVDWQRAVHEAVKSPSIAPYFSPQDNSIWNEMTQEGESAFAMVFAPGNTRHTDCRGHEILGELKRLSVGRLPMFGGCAGDDWAMETNYVFLGSHPYPDSLLVAVFRTSLKFGIGMAHGFQPGSPTVTATAVSEHEVLELDGRPADEVYAEMLGQTVDSLASKHLTCSTGRPVGIRDAYGQHTINVASYFTTGGGVRFAQPIAPGTPLTVMERSEEEMVGAGREALLRAVLRSNITNPAVIFTCSCALRSRLLGKKAPEEVSRMGEVMPEVPVLGFYSFGEFGSSMEGLNQQYHEGITVLLLGQELSYSAQVAMENRRLTSQLESSIAELSQVQEALREAKDGLETKVRKRTAELEMANEQLQSAMTERMRVEEELRNSLEWLTLAQDAAKAGSWEWDLLTDEGLWSDEVWSLLGLEPHSFQPCYEAWTGTIHPEDRACVGQAIQEASSKGMELNTEWRVRVPEGAERWLLSRARPVREESGQAIRYIGIVMDITDRKRAEKALRESEERFRAIFEGATDCMWIKDRSLKYTHVNPAMCETLGLPASSIIGRQTRDICGEETGRQSEELDSRVLKGESIDFERARSVRGTMMRFHDTWVPLRNQPGDIVGICAISRNVTERKKATAVAPGNDQAYTAPAMQDALKQARRAAATDGIVLLQGESGSGKDFLARWIHDHSKRSSGPLFAINCAAVAKELAESELFGHERGSFTGALGLKKGLLELAEGGTILLNEIGELALPLQAKLLTFLDTRSFMRVGGRHHIYVDARLIAATHRDLHSEVEEKRFLEPLYYRLNVFPIRVPPLRERTEDLPILVEEIMSKLASELPRTVMPIIDPSAIAILSEYDWPGNVRELRNVLERSLMLWHGGPFTLQMPRRPRPEIQKAHAGKADDQWSHVVRYSPDKGLDAVVKEVEISLYEHVLKMTRGNKNEAAKLLKISRGALYRYLKKWEGKLTK